MTNPLIPKFQNKKIAYSVLNWGMGHLTRSLSVFKELSKNNEVHFFGDVDQINFLKVEDCQIVYHEFSNYNLNFSGKSFLVEMIFNSPRMIQAIQVENAQIQKIQEKENFDLIISDNRFGFRIEGVKSVILTHQLNIKSPLFEKQGSKLNQIYLNKFDEIWVPDDANHTFSGELSRAELKKPVIFLGNISDLKCTYSPKTIDYFVIGSGPEPYRSEFMMKMYHHLSTLGKKVVMTGFPKFESEYENIIIQEQMNRNQIEENINQAHCVLSKAGYTTLLDLAQCKAKAILFPTKTQYEQEYLAEHLNNHPHFTFLSETEISSID
ncbi:MAG: hypothetical protein KDC84_03070 [Crocinitomicaceae bacterium]|nr:hypothetical protein [Crocinitomicaceae bacterium]